MSVRVQRSTLEQLDALVQERSIGFSNLAERVEDLIESLHQSEEKRHLTCQLLQEAGDQLQAYQSESARLDREIDRLHQDNMRFEEEIRRKESVLKERADFADRMKDGSLTEVYRIIEELREHFQLQS